MTPRTVPEPEPPPESYVIDVCGTCGLKAVYPFCAHRSENERWTYPLAVKPSPAARAGLIANMRSKVSV